MNNQNKSNGTTLGGVVQIIFIILKLTHLVDWSWFWVLSPLWVSFAAIIIIYTIATITVLKKRRTDEGNKH